MISFAQLDKTNNGNYLNLLTAISRLSGLFSENAVPYLNYRSAENIFCRSFNADNLSRSDTAFDANYQAIGVGLKTFISTTDASREKIAEFNQLSHELRKFQNIDLARELSKYRNERIEFAKRLYNLNESVYHIVARKENELRLFETDYDLIDIDKLKIKHSKKTSLQFNDGKNSYSYNFSKSTLFRQFITPSNAFCVPIKIIDDPYKLLLDLFDGDGLFYSKTQFVKGVNFVVLPLYGRKEGRKFVFERSGLNQWNAAGRKRDVSEIYLPIPALIHTRYPNFFPARDTKFTLTVPSKEVFNAKVCQDNSKALMTDPNKALSDWLLRRILQLAEGELATIEKLDELGFDSVIIIKENSSNFKIDIMKSNSYESFKT